MSDATVTDADRERAAMPTRAHYEKADELLALLGSDLRVRTMRGMDDLQHAIAAALAEVRAEGYARALADVERVASERAEACRAEGCRCGDPWHVALLLRLRSLPAGGEG